jgi:hypothetical protein
VINEILSLLALHIDLSQLYSWQLYFFFSLFFKQEMELSLVGLQNAGKTSLVNAVAVCINSLNLRYITMFDVVF